MREEAESEVICVLPFVTFFFNFFKSTLMFLSSQKSDIIKLSHPALIIINLSPSLAAAQRVFYQGVY